ncbi:MAG: biopolymer transporter ExbD [Thermodesulfobacteriota bacterium]|nr:biopolymer transporter ExbD [Thermodesulfobacteriota bacterium]
MRFKKIKEEEPRLGLAPLIDVVFLLLIFFMLTSHFQVASGVSIRLPKVTQKAYDDAGRKIVLVIDRQGGIYLNGEKVGLKELSRPLKGLVDKDGLVHLILEADKDVKHGMVVQVMDIAKTAGVSSIIIAAQWEPEKVI